MSDVHAFYERDHALAERLRVEFNENEPKLIASLREEMGADRGKFLMAALGTAYNYVPYPRFEQVGPQSDFQVKSRVQVALEGLDSLVREHRALAQDRNVLVIEDGDEYLLLEALSALRKTKEQAHRTSQSFPQFQNLTERDFGIPRIDALMGKLGGETPALLLSPTAEAPKQADEAGGQADAAYPSAPREIAVELPGGATASWVINPGLSDRWGNVPATTVGPEADVLRNDPILHARLREQMWDETTFIGIKDGRYGVVFESEYAVRGDEVHEDQDQLVEREAMLSALREQAVALAAKFPAIELCLVPADEAVMERPGLWAWVSDGALNAAQRQELGAAMLDAAAYIQAPAPRTAFA